MHNDTLVGVELVRIVDPRPPVPQYPQSGPHHLMSASASPIVLGSVLSMTCTCRPSTLWYRSMHHHWHVDHLADRLCARGKRENWNWRVYADASEPMRLCTILSKCASPGSRGLCLAVTVGWRCISCCPFTALLDQDGPRTQLVESNTSQTFHTFHDQVFVEHCLSLCPPCGCPSVYS